jgi:hypothetical protein
MRRYGHIMVALAREVHKRTFNSIVVMHEDAA